ncbi:MAG: DNA adenine methylase [Muribaculaceae bacterium]|nr:DNA adenine methylase [Muribaculaceae bacterium]
MNEDKKKKRPRKPKELENQPGKYDERNKLNDLDGRTWLLLTKSFWTSEPSLDDKAAYNHPAPFMIKDIEKLISLFTKKGMTVLDPFVGSGTTLIAAHCLGRRGIGIDLNEEYKQLYHQRLNDNIDECQYIVGDSLKVLDNIEMVDYIVTSPPYHNILRNNSKGTRNNTGKNYRMSARDGVEYYSELDNDLGNFDKYEDFLTALKNIMSKAYICLRNKKYASIIISDFTVDKKEMCVQSDVVRLMQDIGFSFVGTTILIQTVKPLYPFGYPYAYKINHHHQNIINFRKDEL